MVFVEKLRNRHKSIYFKYACQEGNNIKYSLFNILNRVYTFAATYSYNKYT